MAGARACCVLATHLKMNQEQALSALRIGDRCERAPAEKVTVRS
jgi:hypothetical protein